MNNPLRTRSYQQTKRHYEDLRQVVYEFSEEEFRALGATFSEISYSDTVEADNWNWDNAEKTPSWEWRSLYHNYHSHSGIKRFDLAVRSRGNLCALCYGVPSRGKLILKLHALSRRPQNNPLSGNVLSMVLFSADSYARLIGAEEMWLCNPMNNKLVSLYESVGFTAHFNGLGIPTHLSMRLQS